MRTIETSPPALRQWFSVPVKVPASENTMQLIKLGRIGRARSGPRYPIRSRHKM